MGTYYDHAMLGNAKSYQNGYHQNTHTQRRTDNIRRVVEKGVGKCDSE